MKNKPSVAKKAENEVVIKVENLSKTFKIPLEASNGIKQKLINTLKGVKGYREFTPLNDISFEINKGDFFGIVGRNGSGKSTLLKTMAGIYTPNAGSVTVNGSLVPFIELGVGFNPELTGRENVFLNGALLGFSHEEMEGMYQEIVDFAEIEEFMDEKLKNYSSGMQVRLAFSIAIQAKGDILLLDEVLAVGDEAFQRKCFNYFAELKREKKTVVLVTHDMGSVKRFCTKAILIEKGVIKAAGSPDDIANQYILDNLEQQSSIVSNKGDSLGVVKSIRITPQSPLVLRNDDSLVFEVEYTFDSGVKDLYLGISVLYGNTTIIEHGTIDAKPKREESGKLTYTYELSMDKFVQGQFTISAAVLNKKGGGLVAFTGEDENLTFTLINKRKPMGGLLYNRGRWI